MGELRRHHHHHHHHHSMAYTTSSLHSWDLQNLGVFKADMSLDMDETSPFVSPLPGDYQYSSDDFSTGYLEDALVEFSERSKRRRLLLFTDQNHHHLHLDDHDHFSSKDYAMSYWNNNDMNCNWSQISSFNGVSDGHVTSSSEANCNNSVEIKTPEEITSSIDQALDSSPSSIFQKPTSVGVDEKLKTKGVVKGVVYPFALVKPGGKEDDVTLHDINERILMPPTRPVRHPVGDFACRPCVSPEGPGLSGKAVVALTRIQTRGSGTITIIRTRG